MSTRAEQILGSAAIDLGDPRLAARLRLLVDALAAQPEASLAQACGSWAAQQAAYRFFDNAAVSVAQLAAALGQATAARCAGAARVLVIQDTTPLDYTAHHATQHLGTLDSPSGRGLLLHSCLTVTESGTPLGVVDLQLWARASEPDPTDDRRHQRPIEGKESAKWLHGLSRAVTRLGAGTRAVTVADREADVYELFLLAAALDADWLIRARHDRALAGAEGRLLATVEAAPVCGQLTLQVPRDHQRPPRQATVEVRRATVVVVPPRQHPGPEARWWVAHPEVQPLNPGQPGPLRVGVVLVTEPAPPAGDHPLRWLLMTNLPVETVEQALRYVRWYRLRWLIERWHFILKQGCRVERLQLQDGERLQRAVAVYAGVAWWLLWLTEQARATPEAPCSVVFDADAWQALYAATQHTLVLPVAPPPLRTMVRQLASLGGFPGRHGDGEPGVQTLWRGVRRLHDILATWRLLHPCGSTPATLPPCV
jgi:hypothetical protein